MALKKLDEAKYSTPSRLIYGRSLTGAWSFDHHILPPVTFSTTFRLDSAERGATGFASFAHPNSPDGGESIYFYRRMGEPDNDILQHALALAEGGEIAVAYGSGMGAVHAGACFALNRGDEIIAHRTLYGCTYSLFSGWLHRFGVTTHFCDMTKADGFLPFLNQNTRVLYLESPANPNLELLDLSAIAAAVRVANEGRPENKKIITVIDNTFATPFCQRPLSHGIDVVVHSLTKGICGFGTEMGGAVITRKEFEEPLIMFRKDFGSVIAPLSAWNILTYGLSTLSLRMPKLQSNALEIAKYLEAHPKVERVVYPGLESFAQRDIAQRMLRDYAGNFAPGFMVYFILKGSGLEAQRNAGWKMMDHIAQNAYCVTLAVSLGQLRTLIEHPASMTHSAYPPDEQLKRGIDPGGIRLSLGIEEPADIIKDLEAALREV